jgi:hypothetical protein
VSHSDYQDNHTTKDKISRSIFENDKIITGGNFPETAKIIRATSIKPRPFQYWRQHYDIIVTRGMEKETTCN